MTKPSDVSQDAWKAAKEAIYTKDITDAEIKARGYVDLTTSVSRAIDAAVKAEREACARVAENRDPHWPDDADHIAQAIRNRSAE